MYKVVFVHEWSKEKEGTVSVSHLRFT